MVRRMSSRAPSFFGRYRLVRRGGTAITSSPHERGELRQLGRRELREVPLAQPLGHRGDPPDGGHAVVGVVVVRGVGFLLAGAAADSASSSPASSGGSSPASAGVRVVLGGSSARSADSTIMFCCGAVTSGRRGPAARRRTSR